MSSGVLRKRNVLDIYGKVDMLILSSQVRYNNRVRIKNEDLAQHSYFVAYNILKVAYDYNIPKNISEEAICRALVHDLDEQYTSDIPHDCKVEYPELRELVKKIGLRYIEQEAPEAVSYFIDYSNKHDLPNLLVDIGDALSVLQYTNRELLLGNETEDMQIISNEIKARVIRLFDELETEVSKLAKKNEVKVQLSIYDFIEK